MGRHFQVALNDVYQEKADGLKKEFGVEKDSELLKKLIDIAPKMSLLTGIIKCGLIPIGVRVWAHQVRCIITGVMEDFNETD